MTSLNDLFIRSFRIDWDRIGSDSYLRRIASLKDLQELAFTKNVTFFAGENGTGKSTLLEALAVAAGFNPEGGTRNYAFSSRDTHSELYQAVGLVRGMRRPVHGYFLRAESFYNVATQEEEYSKLASYQAHFHEKSHGESFLALARDNFTGGGLYFLDEPEAALSAQGQLSLLLKIHQCAKNGAQFVIATHSPIFLSLPEAEILYFNDEGVHPCAYEETDSYRIYEMFLSNRQQVLHHLFAEEE
ncbi:MAG: ABC transporter ATP-binding protein [Erysipelotrichaceae bacterium]|nr:ABC transporter ATP-binding protein [Erysipelotrichaceae bacterium]